ncbi:hypothetical protein IQ07DRAFT_588233 [Pyrenochaeta sp. DS3sAY3a]|nr:hypothetical protein IQ07DRAFT_588233 [Pyrenochaeta sp. DS3sAY3a]
MLSLPSYLLLLLLTPSMSTPSSTPTTTSSTTPTSSPPVTRIAAFTFHANVKAAQKADRTSAFLALYARYPELLAVPPRGGRPLDTPLKLTGVKRESGWDTGFVVVFKNEEARKTFDASPLHDEVKHDTDPLLERVFVYDFVDQANLGW